MSKPSRKDVVRLVQDVSVQLKCCRKPRIRPSRYPSLTPAQAIMGAMHQIEASAAQMQAQWAWWAWERIPTTIPSGMEILETSPET